VWQQTRDEEAAAAFVPAFARFIAECKEWNATSRPTARVWNETNTLVHWLSLAATICFNYPAIDPWVLWIDLPNSQSPDGRSRVAAPSVVTQRLQCRLKCGCQLALMSSTATM